MMDPVHLPEWTFDRKRISANSNLNLNLKPYSNPNPENIFEKTKWRHFSVKCPDTDRNNGI